MKKLMMLLAWMLTIGVSVSQAQTVTDSWALGFGLDYPRYYAVNITALNSDYGGHLSLQRNFSESVGLRLRSAYSHLEGEWTDASHNLVTQTTNLMTGDLDMLYYVVPCAPVSPYLFAGVGVNHKNITNGQTGLPDDGKWGSQLNVGTGAEFKLNPNWRFITEFGFHKTNNSELEATIVPTELNGRDSYYVLSVGLSFLFNQGEPSKKCEPCCQTAAVTMAAPTEMKDMTDYGRIEKMIERHIPKEVVGDRYIVEIAKDRLELVGVNFAFDKSDLLPESFPVLDKSVNLLYDQPNVKVEIEGYTDYIGTEAYNQELSVERAKTVRAYLISKGIDAKRLSVVGYGENNPVRSNETDAGRAKNRRIVFRIIR